MSLLATLVLLQTESRNEARIQAIFDRDFKTKFDRVSVLVQQAGRTLFVGNYGPPPVTRKTPYRIGSLTKMFTAGLIVLLERDGKLRFTDPVGKFLPELPEEWRKVTIDQLIHHTGGIPEYSGLPMLVKAKNPVEPQNIWRVVAKSKLRFTPGSKWEYSNLGYVLLGNVIEKAGGASYDAQLAKRLLGPAGMTASGIGVGPKSIPTGVNEFGKAPLDIHPSWYFSAGGMYASIDDLAKWDEALRGDKLFKPKEKARMFAPDPIAEASGNPYGFGWLISKMPDGSSALVHEGEVPGFHSLMVRRLGDEMSIMVLSNRSNGPCSEFAQQVVQVISNRMPEQPIPDDAPHITERHKDLLQSILDEKQDEKRFDPGFLKAVGARLLNGARKLKQVGRVEKLELLEVYEDEGIECRLYRATIGKNRYKLLVGENQQGLVAIMRISG